MDLLSKLEKRFGSWAIPNLALYLIGIQAIGVVMLLTNRADYADLILHGSSVLHRGQWWRLFSFMMLPRTLSPLWLFFAFYIFYLIGNSLEQHWGTFRFNLFILSGYLLTIAMAFINPGVVITNTFFLGSVLIAFSTLYANFEFLLFFIIPVKAKWFGWFWAAMYLYVLLTGDWGSRLCVLAAFINYGLFFGRDFIHAIVAGQRRKAFLTETKRVEAQPLHTCSTCGATDKSDESLRFRYCSTCGKCFCDRHMDNHQH